MINCILRDFFLWKCIRNWWNQPKALRHFWHRNFLINTISIHSNGCRSLFYSPSVPSCRRLRKVLWKTTKSLYFFSHRRRKLCSHRDLGSFVVDNDIKGLSMHDSKQITRMISAALNFLSNYRISGKKMGNWKRNHIFQPEMEKEREKNGGFFVSSLSSLFGHNPYSF